MKFQDLLLDLEQVNTEKFQQIIKKIARCIPQNILDLCAVISSEGIECDIDDLELSIEETEINLPTIGSCSVDQQEMPKVVEIKHEEEPFGVATVECEEKGRANEEKIARVKDFQDHDFQSTKELQSSSHFSSFVSSPLPLIMSSEKTEELLPKKTPAPQLEEKSEVTSEELENSSVNYRGTSVPAESREISEAPTFMQHPRSSHCEFFHFQFNHSVSPPVPAFSSYDDEEEEQKNQISMTQNGN